jgi:hypothetical protein
MAAVTEGIVTAFLSAVSSAFEWALEKLKLDNSDDMRKNAAAKTDGELKDKAGKIVAKRDIDAVRKAVAE